MTAKLEDYNHLIQELKGELPSIPLIMNELLEVISDSQAAIFAVQNIVKNDKSILAKIFKYANTIENRQGGTERIISISDALQRLGFEKVKKLIISNSVFDFMKIKESGFDLNSLWKHSCGVATASDVLAKRFELKLFDHAYLCGLLHDIGKTAKLKFSQKQFFRELRHAKRYDCSLIESERMLAKLEHDKLGYLLVKEWGISPIVEQTTRWHHEANKERRVDLEDPNLNKLVDIVFMANQIIKDLNFGYSGYTANSGFCEEFLRRRKIDEHELQKCIEVVQSALDEEEEHLAIFSKE